MRIPERQVKSSWLTSEVASDGTLFMGARMPFGRNEGRGDYLVIPRHRAFQNAKPSQCRVGARQIGGYTSQLMCHASPPRHCLSGISRWRGEGLDRKKRADRPLIRR